MVLIFIWSSASWTSGFLPFLILLPFSRRRQPRRRASRTTLRAMNVLQDPASKTSINSLLNPQDGASFQSHLTPITANAISENAEHSQGQLALDYGHGYGHGNASYSLRTAATWDHQALGKQPRQTNYQDQHRAYPPYQQPTMGHTLTPPTYPERNPTLSEGGSERPQSEYGDSVHGWQRSPQASAGVAYNGHPSSVQYSHDHTSVYTYVPSFFATNLTHCLGISFWGLQVWCASIGSLKILPDVK